MRKLVILAAAALLVAPLANANATTEPPTAGAELIRIALTSFLHHPNQGPPSLIFGGGMSFDIGNDMAFAGRGPCHRKERRGRKFWACHASARGVRVLPTGFFMDPLLQVGHMELDRGGYHHRVDFVGDGEPEIVYGGTVAGGVVFLLNEADTAGKLFGHRVPTRRDRPLGFMVEIGFVDVLTVDGVRVRMGDDGRMHVHALIPAGRATR